jgi:hypothetical protein
LENSKKKKFHRDLKIGFIVYVRDLPILLYGTPSLELANKFSGKKKKKKIDIICSKNSTHPQPPGQTTSSTPSAAFSLDKKFEKAEINSLIHSLKPIPIIDPQNRNYGAKNKTSPQNFPSSETHQNQLWEQYNSYGAEDLLQVSLESESHWGVRSLHKPVEGNYVLTGGEKKIFLGFCRKIII